jgi:MYXO-CTERM domain-containing protein
MSSPDVNYAARHLMTHTATIDGRPVSSWPIVGVFDQLSIESQCLPQSVEIESDSCGGIGSVPVGRHTLSVQTRVLGYEGVIAPVTLDIETRCPGSDRPVGDDGPVTADPTSLDEPQPDPVPTVTDATAEEDTDATTDEAADEATDGNVSRDLPHQSCAFGSGQASSNASAGLALLALGLVARRRRRSHRAL